MFFEFYHGNNRLRFPTFRTGRQTWLISSARVQNAIATGENICSLLLRFNPGGNDFTVNRNAPFSKTALWGFFFSFVSVFLAVVTMISELYLSSVYSGLEQKAANGMAAYVLAFLAAAPAVTGLVLGANVLRKSSVSPVRGIGFARTSVIMSSVVLALLLLTMALYLFG